MIHEKSEGAGVFTRQLSIWGCSWGMLVFWQQNSRRVSASGRGVRHRGAAGNQSGILTISHVWMGMDRVCYKINLGPKLKESRNWIELWDIISPRELISRCVSFNFLSLGHRHVFLSLIGIVFSGGEMVFQILEFYYLGVLQKTSLSSMGTFCRRLCHSNWKAGNSV